MSAASILETARPRRIALRGDADWPVLLDLWVAAWRATYSDIDFTARRDWLVAHIYALEAKGARTLCLVGEAPPALAGFVIIDPATGWLDQLCVHPAYFGAGAATVLIEAARKISPARVRLDVNADNARALAFYKRQGFTRTGEGPVSQSGRRTAMMEWRAQDGARVGSSLQ